MPIEPTVFAQVMDFRGFPGTVYRGFPGTGRFPGGFPGTVYPISRALPLGDSEIHDYWAFHDCL